MSPSLLGSVKILIPYKDFPLDPHWSNPGLTSYGRIPSLSVADEKWKVEFDSIVHFTFNSKISAKLQYN